MKYIESYKLFEGVTVPTESTVGKNDTSSKCGTCLSKNGGKPLLSPPPESLDRFE